MKRHSKDSRRIKTQDERDNELKWAFVEGLPRRTLETLAAALIEQLCMNEQRVFPQDGEDLEWSGADICEELSTVLTNMGVTNAALRSAVRKKPVNPKTAAIRDALEEFIHAIDCTGGITQDELTGAMKAPMADRSWPDLADVYEQACAALGRTPLCVDYHGKDAGNHE